MTQAELQAKIARYAETPARTRENAIAPTGAIITRPCSGSVSASAVRVAMHILAMSIAQIACAGCEITMRGKSLRESIGLETGVIGQLVRQARLRC